MILLPRNQKKLKIIDETNKLEECGAVIQKYILGTSPSAHNYINCYCVK